MSKQFRIEFTEDCIYRLTVVAETKEEALEKFNNSDAETWDCRNSEINVHNVYELEQAKCALCEICLSEGEIITCDNCRLQLVTKKLFKEIVKGDE